jgi:hypothetical protein
VLLELSSTKGMNENILNLLLTGEERNKKRFKIPYIFNIKNADQELVYFGSNHSYDPKDEQFEMIEKLWDEMKNKYPIGMITSVIEGSLRKKILERDEIILKSGESGFLQHLANTAGIEVVCLEPLYGKIMDQLALKHQREKVFYYSVASVCLQWNNLTIKPNFEKYIVEYLEKDKEETGWIDFDFSIKNIKKIHQDIFGTEFDENDKNFFYKTVDPTGNSVLSQISRDMDLIRDSNIVEGIVSKWKEGRSIFVVYGSGHAVTQEPALLELLK